MERREPGDVVPMPTNPLSPRNRRLPLIPTSKVEVAIREFDVVVPDTREFPPTLKAAEGEVVPMPRRELVVSTERKEEESRVVPAE